MKTVISLHFQTDDSHGDRTMTMNLQTRLFSYGLTLSDFDLSYRAMKFQTK